MKHLPLFVLLGSIGCTAPRIVTETTLADDPEYVRMQLRTASSPIVSEKDALFILERPSAHNVELAGDFTDWQDRPIKLERTGPFFHGRVPLDPRSRIEYQFIVDGQWEKDPTNTRICDNGVGGRNSWFVMPAYTSPPTLPTVSERGRIESFTVDAHEVQVYLPPNFDAHHAYPTMYFQDGQDYVARADAAHVLDALIATKRIASIVGIFVRPVDRGREYWCDPDYVRFFVKSLLPWVEDHYPVRREREARGVMGASLGGLISMHLAYEHPDLFGRVASQSGAFASEDRIRSNGTHAPGTKIFDRIRAAKIHPLRMHLTVGLYEGLLDQNRTLSKMLGGLNVSHAYVEHAHGHTWTFWKEQLPRILEYLWK